MSYDFQVDCITDPIPVVVAGWTSSPVLRIGGSPVLVQLSLREVLVTRDAVVVLCVHTARMSLRGLRPRDIVQVRIPVGDHGSDVIEALHWDV